VLLVVPACLEHHLGHAAGELLGQGQVAAVNRRLPVTTSVTQPSTSPPANSGTAM
jgi:hypothetical protein